MNPAGTCAIAVMAKAPRAGQVKTRLRSMLAADEATALSAAFLCDVTENIRRAARAAPIRGFVAFAPAGQEAAFDGLLAPGTRLVLADGSDGEPPDGVEGLGRTLLHAARTLFAQGFGAVCLLNADSPTLPTARLVEAAAALLRPGARAVLGPAEDGGYYLIGMKAPHAALFARIAWSTDAVAARTRERAAEAGLDLHALDPWFDVDDPTSLRRLTAELAGGAAPGAYPAPATARCLARLGIADRLRAKLPAA